MGGRGLAGSPADLPGAVRGRRARHGAYRRPQSPRGPANSHRLHRRHQHGCHRRRPVRQRHDGEADRCHHALARLAGGVSRCAAAPGPRIQAQAGRPQLSGAAAPRPEARQALAAEGFDSRAEAAGDLAPADPAVQQHHEFRSAAHPVSRGGDRSENRQRATHGQGRSRHRHARQHVGAGGIRAGRVGRTVVGRWRAGGEPAHQRGASDACRRSHRIGCQFSPAGPCSARFRAVDLQSDAGDFGAQGLRLPARHLGSSGYLDRAQSRDGDRDGFTVPANVIAGGAAAARDAVPKLSAYSVGDSAYREYLARRAAREPGLPAIQFVRVDEQSKRYEKTIMAEMQPLVGKPLDLNEVGRRITELYGLGNFETLDYTLVEHPAQPAGRPNTGAPGAAAAPSTAAATGSATATGTAAGAGAAAGTGTAAPTGDTDDDESGLELRARRKSWGPNYLRFGLNLEDDFQGNSRYNAAARFILTEINELGAELLTDVQIGSDPKVVSEFYQPLDASRTWFVAPSARVEARDLTVYTDDVEVADFRDREVEADLDVGRNLGNWGEIRVGIHRTNGFTHVRLGDPDLVEQQYNNGEFFFKFSYDRLDNVHFPRDGQTFSLQWDANRTDLGADIASDKVQADWLMARSNGRNTILLWTSAGSTLDGRYSANALPEFYSLGGFFNLSGLAPDSLFGPQYAIARAIYFRKIGRGGEGFFEFPAYIGMSFEVGNTWEHRGDISYGSAHKDASVFLAFDTFLGPVYLGSGYDHSGNAAFYLFLGRTF